MHELPKELTKSLRSWRGSVVKNSVDIEKVDYYDDDEDECQHSQRRAVHPRTPSRHDNDNVNRQQWEHSPVSLAQTTSPVRNGSYHLIDSRTPKPDVPPPRRAATFDKQTLRTNKKSVFDAPGVTDLDGAASRLDDDLTSLTPADFYELMGMAPPTAPNTYPKRFAVPNGLYSKIKQSYDEVTVRYRTFDVLTYFLMTLQLLLSAVFIILGSLGNVDSHLAVAILGALGTVVAGSLALMKGQGLPNRLRQGRDSLRYVLFEAQELWWDVGARRQVMYKDIVKVREDYLRVMEDQRRNHPDTWNPSSNKIAAGIQSGGRKSGWASRLTLPLTRLS